MESVLEEQEDTSKLFKVKPVCKPDVQLKKSRQRIFNENSIDLLYSFGHQPTLGSNLYALKENIVILIAGNYLNFLNIDTLAESFLPSVFGAGFCSVAVHPNTFFFAAAEKGPKFCINIFSYPALEAYKKLKHDSCILPTCSMEFHPHGDLLIAVTCDPENKVLIWLWELELMVYISDDSALPIYSLHFATQEKDTFITSGKGHVTFWTVTSMRDDRNAIQEVQVTQQEELLNESSKVDILCTVSVANTFLSATAEGYLLLWNYESLTFDDTIKIAMPDDRPCHEGCIYHILIEDDYIITFGSDGNMKFWDYNDIIKALNPEQKEEPSLEEDDDEDIQESCSADEECIECIYIKPAEAFLISKTSEIVYGIISSVGFDATTFLIQNKNGSLFQADITNDFSTVAVTSLLSGVGYNLVDLLICPVYPLVATASSLGSIVIYDCVAKEVFMLDSFSVPITCMLWPSTKVDYFASSLLVGFEDGTLRWLSFSQKQENFVLKFVMKPHACAIDILKLNDSCTILVSQGLDSKLFFYSVERFSLTPLGFYINHHDVIAFTWLKYNSSSEEISECKETLLILCKYSYMIETEIPNAEEYKKSAELRNTFFIENKCYQIYKINGLREYHKLGDRIYDSECEEESDLNEAGKKVLKHLKYEEKRERRENRRQDLGLSGPINPPYILSYLPSIHSDHIWLSLDKEDFGYIFEFKFEGKFTEEPIELIPVNALEILTAEIIPVLSMQYSQCGHFIFMGLQNGSLNICYLEQAFHPTSAYDFARYQIHDSELGAVNHLRVSSEGSFIATAGRDGNIFAFLFNLCDFETVEEYGEKPECICEDMVEDISSEKLSLEDELKKGLGEKYHLMQEQRISDLESLKEEYLLLKEMHAKYSDLCESSLGKLSVPDKLILKPENFGNSKIAAEMFIKRTSESMKDIDVQFQKDVVKATLLHEKYFKFYKSRIDHERLMLKCSKDNFLSTFRGCRIPENLIDSGTGIYPQLYKVKEQKKRLNVNVKKEKINNEKLSLEHELSIACKAIIDYPSDTPVSELISKFNQRKEERIKMLKEHIMEHEISDNLFLDHKKYDETHQEIEASYFKFKETEGFDQSKAEHMCTYTEKKDKTVSYYLKISEFGKFFNFLTLPAFEKDSTISVMNYLHIEEDEETLSALMRQVMHIYYKKGNTDAKRNGIKVKWNSLEKLENVSHAANEIAASRIEEDQLSGKRMFDNFISVLMAAKPKLSCEKKFKDLRFILKCIELNIFKREVDKEKKWLKIVKELEDILSEEYAELSGLEKKRVAIKKKRELEKDNWIEIYNQFCKAIGLKHKHKGYFKQVFKKKIRPDDEKEPFKRHTSSESSDSEQNIHSDDDSININPREVDPNLLREVMHFRIKRHEVEKKMKHYKRSLLANSIKESTLQRRIQRVKEALDEAFIELNSIPLNRKLDWENMIWPVVLHPENVHIEFIDKQVISVDEQKRIVFNEMSDLHNIITEELKDTNKFIRHVIVVLTDRVVNAEISDLIDIAIVFNSIVDFVSETVDEEYRKLYCPDSSDVLKVDTHIEEKPINVIREILQSASEEVDMTEESSGKIESKEKERGSVSVKVSGGGSEEIKVIAPGEKDYVKEVLKVESISKLTSEKVKDTPFVVESKKTELKSWRNVCDDLDVSSVQDFDINSVLHKAPTLDSSLLADNECSYLEDYYMQPFCLDDALMNQFEIEESASMDVDKYAKMLRDSDISELVEDLIKNVLEEEEQLASEKRLSYSYFPTHPGGGFVLTKVVLLSMQEEDPGSFSFTEFFQEIVHHEKVIKKSKKDHISPHIEEPELLFAFFHKPVADFISLDSKDIINALAAHHNINITTVECEHYLRNLDKRLQKSKNKRIKVEQVLIGVLRERVEEMGHKFSGMVNLDLLQDVIENPHLRIKKYESDKRIDRLKQNLKKLKASEVVALKSLDKYGFEETKVCHELLRARNEFKLLNKKYSSRAQIIPKIGDGA